MNYLIQTCSPDIDASLAFYHNLGFKSCIVQDGHIVSDGQVELLINQSRKARNGLVLYQESWETVYQLFVDKYAITKTQEGYLCSDPSGMWIRLIEGPLPTYEFTSLQPTIAGTYAGLSLEAISINRVVAFYKHLDFSPNMGSEDQGWIALSHPSGLSISIMKAGMCPHLFFNPSLTYFNGGKNLEVIEKIRKAGIEITEEITAFNTQKLVDNIIVKDPGGFGFFIFND